MKRAIAVILLLVVLCSTAVSEVLTFGSLFAQFREHYSVAAAQMSENAETPKGLNLSQREMEIFKLGYAAGYDKYRVIDAGLEEMTYVLNTSSKRFHDTLCMGGQAIKPENRQEVQCDRQDLIDQGYKPCGMCNP